MTTQRWLMIHFVPEAVMSDAGVRGEADDGEALRGRDLRREDGGRAAAKPPEALGGVQCGRILIILEENEKTRLPDGKI